MQRLLRRLKGAQRGLGRLPGRGGLLFQPLDFLRLLGHRLALAGGFSQRSAALRRAAPSRRRGRGRSATARPARVIARGRRGLPGRLDGLLLLRLHGQRPGDRRSEGRQLAFQSLESLRLPCDGGLELLAFRQPAEHLMEAGHLLTDRLDRRGGLLRRLERAGLLLPLLLCGFKESLGFGGPLHRRLGGGGGARRFIEPRDQGHGPRRGLDPRGLPPHRLSLLRQRRPPRLDLRSSAVFACRPRSRASVA